MESNLETKINDNQEKYNLISQELGAGKKKKNKLLEEWRQRKKRHTPRSRYNLINQESNEEIPHYQINKYKEINKDFYW